MKTTKVFTTAAFDRVPPSLAMTNNHLRGVHRANSQNLGVNPLTWANDKASSSSLPDGLASLLVSRKA
jgi:hypothetical protein